MTTTIPKELTVRQYYKGQALAGLTSNPLTQSIVANDSGDMHEQAKRLGRLCAFLADEMMREDEEGAT